MAPTPFPRTRPLEAKSRARGQPVPSASMTSTSTAANVKDQVQQFREARLAREKERLERLRNCRLKSSNDAASNIKACMSITNNSSNMTIPKRTVAAAPPRIPVAKRPLRVTVSQPVIERGAKLRRSLGNKRKSIVKRKVESKADVSKPLLRKFPKAEVRLTKTTQLRLLQLDPVFQLSIPDFSFSKIDQFKLPTTLPLSTKPDYESMKALLVKRADHVDGTMTKTCPDGDALMSSEGLSEVQEFSPPSILFSEVKENKAEGKSSVMSCASVKKTSHVSPLKKEMADVASKIQSPSRIPVKKTSFVSPHRATTSVIPNPSPLKKRLVEWLEKRDHSLENFKHLRCFGVTGPLVKRPRTPFRKAALSTSTLKAIPESKESTPNKDPSLDTSDDEEEGLNTTFTLEEEDKENIICDEQTRSESDDQKAKFPHSEDAKELDKAYGVLFELLKLIQMGYPVEQCKAWLRAIRGRFPQCGDEAIYWECLACLEESDGDLQSAAACYQQAIMHGAEESVTKSLEELLSKMSALNIKPNFVASPKKIAKQYENSLLDTSNIIRSSSIQFAVQEMHNSSAKKNKSINENADTSFTATPVRRSTRLASSTPGVTCVRSLEFLDTNVRKSLVFHGNSALEPRD